MSNRACALTRHVLPLYRSGRLVLIFGGTSGAKGRPLKMRGVLGSCPGGRSVGRLSVSTGGGSNVSHLRGVLVRTAALPRIDDSSIVIAGVHRCRTLAHTLGSVRHMQRNLRLSLSNSLIDRSLHRYLFRLTRVMNNRVAASRMLNGVFGRFYVNGWGLCGPCLDGMWFASDRRFQFLRVALDR